MAHNTPKCECADGVVYGSKGFTLIISYAHAKRLRMPGMERNHLIPKAFFVKGPRETRHLGDYVPVLPLTFEEHRGAKYSFHNMADNQVVGTGSSGFRGCGLNAYLAQLGLALHNSSYTREDVSRAIAACYKYHADIGLEHAAAAIRSFRVRFYDPATDSTSHRGAD
jgi:hypothetical protein